MASTPDPTIITKIQERNGGDRLVVASGGVLDIEPGGAFKINDADVTALLAANVANQVGGVGASYKVARGVHQQAAASDTIISGLATVVAVIATWRDTPTLKQMFLTVTIGDQAGTPAAGSFLSKTFKPTAANDVTPIAASDFTDNLSFNWIAVGT